MALDENGFDVADDWFYWLADVTVVVPLLLIALYVVQCYSHVGDRFSRNLSTFNVLATFAAVLFRIVTFFFNHTCAFYLIETVYFSCEFNLFHFRTALFYQSNKKFYNRLYHLALAVNFLNLYHNFMYLCQFIRIVPLKLGCRSVPGLPSFVVAVPIFAIQIYMLVLGFQTVWKYWRESGKDVRQKMTILWMVLFTYTWDFISSIFLLVFTDTSGDSLLFREAFQFFNKSLSLLLSLMVYLKIRERERTSATKTGTKTSGSNNTVSSATKETKATAGGKLKIEVNTIPKTATSTTTTVSSISATDRLAGFDNLMTDAPSHQ